MFSVLRIIIHVQRWRLVFCFQTCLWRWRFMSLSSEMCRDNVSCFCLHAVVAMRRWRIMFHCLCLHTYVAMTYHVSLFMSTHIRSDDISCLFKQMSLSADLCGGGGGGGDDVRGDLSLVSLIEERIPRYVLRSDSLAEVAGYAASDWVRSACLPPANPQHDVDLSPELMGETLKYFSESRCVVRWRPMSARATRHTTISRNT